ncbi:MAG: response regulator [Planctomycetaceae bacterium]
MTTPTILVIDDSATIRKMVDSHLSQEGYRVVMASTGDEGVKLARETSPNLILLDHQLPGTTGIEVCRRILSYEECRAIPFLVSSTLRKQAYVEYMDVPNVVDSLPKPYKPDLLKMAVANALETGALILSSQLNGTAVPETVEAVEQAAFSGDLQFLSLREVIDFLTNGQKDGMLEVESDRNRVCFFIKEGRIQGVVSASFDAALISAELPEALRELAPLLQFTMATGNSTQAAGLTELLDKNMLDVRTLRKLLRHQAAVLTRWCFLNPQKAFSFLPQRKQPDLMTKVPVDYSLVGLLVEGCVGSKATATNGEKNWTRRNLRGQNMDRTGLSPKQIQLLSILDATPRGTSELADKLGLELGETRRILEGLLLAEWVDSVRVSVEQADARMLVAFEPDTASAAVVRGLIVESDGMLTGHVVRDELSFQLLLKRKSPQIAMIALRGDDELNVPPRVDITSLKESGIDILLIRPAGSSVPIASSLAGLPFIERPYTEVDLRRSKIFSPPPNPVDGSFVAAVDDVESAGDHEVISIETGVA